MRLVADSAARVERLERTVIDDRRTVVRSVERLKAGARSVLSRADVRVCLFAAGLLVAAAGPNPMRGLVGVGRIARWVLTGLVAAEVRSFSKFVETSHRA